MIVSRLCLLRLLPRRLRPERFRRETDPPTCELVRAKLVARHVGIRVEYARRVDVRGFKAEGCGDRGMSLRYNAGAFVSDFECNNFWNIPASNRNRLCAGYNLAQKGICSVSAEI